MLSHHAKLMAARRTLQEGVLSGSLVFPLNGSLAYLKLLWPHFDAGISLADVKTAALTLLTLPTLSNLLEDRDYVRNSIWDVPCVRELRGVRNTNREARGFGPSMQDNEEPLRDRVRNDLFVFVKALLNVEEYRAYARGPVSAPRSTQNRNKVLREAD